MAYPWVRRRAFERPRFGRNMPFSMRCYFMVPRITCSLCRELAVVFRLEGDGTRVPLCAFHMPFKGNTPPPQDDREQNSDKQPLR